MLRAGQLVGGKYRLIHPLGMGGMGTVWRAEHETLQQPVALKLLHAGGAQAERSFKRFKREAQIAASIRHRNIVYISDFGGTEQEPYLVMELLHGVPLSERLFVGEPLSVPGFLHMMDEALQGLTAVHAAGIVHRDLKPANIFLVRESDGTVYPKLLDFGVSRSAGRDQGHTITLDGIVMGTPEYISPEQARGRVGDLRSDLYSLGVVIYEALAGVLPFRADNTADLLVALLNQTPLPLVAHRPELGAPLSEVIMRAIARDPDQRYQSTPDMRAALNAAVAGAGPGLSLPKRFHAPSTPAGLATSSAPPPSSLPPRLAPAELPATAATEVVAIRAAAPRYRVLLLGAGLAAAVALALAITTRAPSAGARVALPKIHDAVIAPGDPAQEAEPPGPPASQDAGATAARDLPEGKTTPALGKAKVAPATKRPKPNKRELFRSPGF